MNPLNRDLVARDDPQPGAAVPQVEVYARPPLPPTVGLRLRHSTRFKVFALVFLAVLGAGSAWSFTRPPLYRSVATVLVEAPEGIGFKAGKEGADAQNLAVQGRVLLARDLLEATLSGAVRSGAEVAGLDADGLGRMLFVQPTPDTNMVELGATGGDPKLLAALVNAWTDAYLARRQRQVSVDVDATLSRLQEEYDRLAASKREKAAALDAYRAQNDIDTMERDGNQALARLASLTTELNKARAEQTKAEAEREALEDAIARGEPVVPESEQGSLTQLESEAAKLRTQLALLEKRYTRVYMENEPSMRDLPGELADLESRIAKKLAQGRDFLRSTLTREIQRARRQTMTIEQQLAVARSEASRFTARYARYETMKQDLEKVDELHRELEARLVDVKAKAPANYAQARVVEPAYAPDRPFYPLYWRDFLYILAGAGASALLAVLLLEFLGRRAREPEEMLPVTGVRVFAPPAAPVPGLERSRALPLSGEPPGPWLPGPEVPSLPGIIQRELLAGEVRALADLADPASRQLLGLLMSGLTPQECADLDESHLDLGLALIRVPGDGRTVRLSPALASELSAHRPIPLWAGASGAATVESLSARIGLLAHDAGLAHPAEIGVGALRHTYIAYLVRQGARLTELEQVIGPLPPAELTRYGVYKPAGPARPLAELDLVYPVFGSLQEGPRAEGQGP